MTKPTSQARSLQPESGREVNEPARVAVVGGGVSGLTAAWRLSENPELQVDLFESQSRLGGVLKTVRRDGYLVEQSADMFTTKDPWALEACRELGIEEELVGADEARRRAFVVHRGTLAQVPQGFVLMRPTQLASMVSTPLLSWKGKLRMFAEPFVSTRRETNDESLQSFVTRRLGVEVFERIVQPLVGGIYTADPEKLSMAAAMPAFAEMERKYGSLWKAPHGKGEQQASGARYGAFVAPRNGMQSIPDALEQQLAGRTERVAIRRDSSVRRADPTKAGWRLTLQDNTTRQYDALIIAAGAGPASRLLAESSPELSETLASIPYASVAVAILGCDQAQIERPVEGFGFVAPLVEQRRILAASFASHKFPGRAPDGKVLIRVFLGGACQSELLENDDETLMEFSLQELASLIGLRGQPEWQDMVRWSHTMPQYHVGHLEKVARVDSLLEKDPRLAIAGNALRGVGVPFCIRSGQQAAERIHQALAKK